MDGDVWVDHCGKGIERRLYHIIKGYRRRPLLCLIGEYQHLRSSGFTRPRFRPSRYDERLQDPLLDKEPEETEDLDVRNRVPRKEVEVSVVTS